MMRACRRSSCGEGGATRWLMNRPVAIEGGGGHGGDREYWRVQAQGVLCGTCITTRVSATRGTWNGSGTDARPVGPGERDVVGFEGQVMPSRAFRRAGRPGCRVATWCAYTWSFERLVDQRVGFAFTASWASSVYPPCSRPSLAASPSGVVDAQSQTGCSRDRHLPARARLLPLLGHVVILIVFGVVVGRGNGDRRTCPGRSPGRRRSPRWTTRSVCNWIGLALVRLKSGVWLGGALSVGDEGLGRLPGIGRDVLVPRQAYSVHSSRTSSNLMPTVMWCRTGLVSSFGAEVEYLDFIDACQLPWAEHWKTVGSGRPGCPNAAAIQRVRIRPTSCKSATEEAGLGAKPAREKWFHVRKQLISLQVCRKPLLPDSNTCSFSLESSLLSDTCTSDPPFVHLTSGRASLCCEEARSHPNSS